MSPVKVGFVTPWYGPAIPGGMENATYQTVRCLHEAGVPVEVLTTTIRDFHADWATNAHPAGKVLIEGVTVRRFPVEKRDRAAFDAVNFRLMNGQPVTAAEERTFIEEMFRVPALYDFISARRDEYIFVFIPYMFATTYYGARIAPERSIVIPCLHDESYAQMRIFKELMPRVRGMVFHATAEQVLAARLYERPPRQIRRVLGLGVKQDFAADAGRFRRKYGLDDPLVLYVGRKERGKNVPLLLDYWQRFKREGGAGKLVLIGSGDLPIPAGLQEDAIDLGFVPAQDKYDAYAAANVFCQPSLNESFSFVIMESWLAGTPVLVHERCAVTREHVRQANGGLYFANYPEFAATVRFLFEHPEVALQLARQGARYVRRHFTWPDIVEQYKQIIDQVGAGVRQEPATT